jgi:hypothetical protein
MEYRFYLNGDPCEEPIGWADFELSMRRDDKTHGIQFEVSTGTLRFYGPDALYLKEQKELHGIKAHVEFVAQEFCDDPYTPFEEIRGQLNFGKYKELCGNQCLVELPVEEDSCRLIFKNKYDQKVDLDSALTFNGINSLPNYTGLRIDMELPPKALQAAVDGSVGEEDNIVEFDETIIQAARFFIRPTYIIERYNNILTGQLVPVSNWDTTDGADFPISPQLLFEDIIACFDGDFEYSGRQKGLLEITENGSNAGVYALKHKIVKWDGNGSIFNDSTLIAEHVFFDDFGNPVEIPYSVSFDNTLSGILTLAEGDGLYNVIEVGVLTALSASLHFKVTYDDDTFFTLSARKECPSTNAEVYLIHETLSRIAESITDMCIRVKSSYYGRIDSQPFAFPSDGCGGLRLLTSGLKIRRAPDGKFFASMKDVVEGLNSIDNIGFDIVPDPDLPNRFLMYIEEVGYFYQDEEVFIIDHIPEGTVEMQEQMHYAKVNVGYKKWEVEGVNGLDEFNSTREYRTSIDTVNNTLDITSNLIAGSYPLEITRQQNFADSGAADTKFDNDIFIVTLKRNAYDFSVEQDNVSSAENFFDPPSIYNFRLSPVRNLMRWYKTIAAGYRNLTDGENKLFFGAGTGNINARGEVIEGAYDAECKIESMPISENQDIFITHFARAEDYTPLYKNETFSFEYPLSISEYKELKASPYGYISYRCGSSGDFEKGFIKEVKFRPAKGMASFSLIKKWS